MSRELAVPTSAEAPQIAWLHGISPEVLADSQRSWLLSVQAHYQAAVEARDEDAVARNNLGWARQMLGQSAQAMHDYERALELDPGLRTARRNLATLRLELGHERESLRAFHEELHDEDGRIWLEELVSTAMRADALQLAGRYAEMLAKLCRGTRWFPRHAGSHALPVPVRPPERFLTVPKLRHDIEQFQYLIDNGILGEEFAQIIADYERTAERLSGEGEDLRVPFEPDLDPALTDVYNRIVHIRHTPRMDRALADGWDPAAVEAQYLERPLGLVVVDDFLRPEALEEVRRFCLESTVWSANRYAHGRLGAFFHDGFNCPLLLQIADELREALPRVIVDRYPLRQLWGFKNGQYLPHGATTHADFAAVNVNFWITPDDANLDPSSGGLVVYDVDAPMSWDFSTYNGRSDIIESFLRQQRASATNIPYRQNRAIIFNSDLFHASAGLTFRPGYENRRVNVTMLYGDRQSDEHHGSLAGRELTGATGGDLPAWRSAAFGRARQRLAIH